MTISYPKCTENFHNLLSSTENSQIALLPRKIFTIALHPPIFHALRSADTLDNNLSSDTIVFTIAPSEILMRFLVPPNFWAIALDAECFYHTLVPHQILTTASSDTSKIVPITLIMPGIFRIAFVPTKSSTIAEVLIALDQPKLFIKTPVQTQKFHKNISSARKFCNSIRSPKILTIALDLSGSV